MIIKINWIKQKIYGIIGLLFTAITAINIEVDEEIAFMLFMLGGLSLCILLSKKRLFSHDYIVMFDVDSMLKG